MRISAWLIVFLLMLPKTAYADWRKAVSPSFIVYGDMKEAPLTEFTRKVERFDTFLRAKFGIAGDSAPARMTIYIVNGSTPVGSLVRGGKTDNFIKGFYTNGPNGPVAILQQLRADGKYDLDSDTILFHEYVHHFMLQYFPAAYPPWFVEGFAEFYSTTEFNKDGMASYGRPAYHRVYDLLEGKGLPIETLLVADVDELDKFGRSSLYARGWLLTHYLVFATERDGQLSTYIKAVNDGTEGLAAARAAFGDLAKLNKDLNNYRDKQRLSYLTQRTATPASEAITVSMVEAGEAATMVERIKVRRHTDGDERPVLIAALEKAKAKYPASAAINILLAQLYHDEDNDKAAIAVADVALAQSPGHPDALLYRGVAEISDLIRSDIVDAARWKAARAMIVKANRADPENPYPLFHYYKSFQAQGVMPPAVAGDGLRKAFELIPQDTNLRFTYAAHLIRDNKLPVARAVIKPMAFSPHGGSGAKYARKMLERLDRAIAKGGRREDFYADGGEPSLSPP
jgi:hypothetical protein